MDEKGILPAFISQKIKNEGSFNIHHNGDDRKPSVSCSEEPSFGPLYVLVINI